MAGIRAIIVENERSALARCADVVRAHAETTLVGTAESYADGLALIHESDPDLLLTDLQLGDGDGTNLIRAWNALPPRADAPPRRSMVISVFGDVDSVVRAVEAGADGYLLKGGSDAEMAASLTTVLAGGAPISAAVAGHLLRRVRSVAEPEMDPQKANAPSLSEREVQVLKRLARGQSYKEVARDLGLSPYTVGDHVKRIYAKLAVGSRGEAVYEAVRGGLIDLES